MAVSSANPQKDVGGLCLNHRSLVLVPFSIHLEIPSAEMYAVDHFCLE